MTETGEPPKHDTAQDAALEASRLERDRTLEAMHRLERELGRASAGTAWLDRVRAALGDLEVTMESEQEEMDRPDALLSMIATENPRRFAGRIRALGERYRDVARQVASLHGQLAEPATVDAADLRHRVGWIIRALHHFRAQQADIVFDALTLDLTER